MATGVARWRSQGVMARALLAAAAGCPEAVEESVEEAAAVEAAVDAATGGGDPRAPFNLAAALLDEADLRASALSCLGETAAFLGAALVSHARDVVGGLCGIISMEVTPPAPPPPPHGEEARLLSPAAASELADAQKVVIEASARVRRAAGLALRRLLEGEALATPRADPVATLANEGIAAPLLRALRNAADSEPDPITRAHVRDALAAIGERVEAAIAARLGASAGGGVAAARGPFAASLAAVDTRTRPAAR
jgi:hypothetical protein